jgi:phage terminase large subunit-like protein
MAKCHLIYPLCGCDQKVAAPALEDAPLVGIPPTQVLVEPDPEVDEEMLETLQQFLELRKKIKRRKLKDSLAMFFKEAWAAMKPGTLLEWGPHIQAVCDHVQWQLEDRARAKHDPTYKHRAQNIVINVPPRSLKTSVLTYATVWAWLRWPDMRIMYLSANPRVAWNSARDARDLIISGWFQKTFDPEWKIRTDQNALTDLGNTAGGARISRGLDGAVTGEGAEWQIVDDPHDLRDSIENIEKCIEGYDSAVANRINDPRSSIRTCIMQRVNIIDLTAHVLKKGWIHVRIPMEYEAKPMCTCTTCVTGVSPFGWKDFRTTEGEVLHPRFTPEFLAGERQRLMEFGYASQHQQRPAVAGGGRIRKDYWGFFRLSGHHAGDHPRPAGCTTSEARVVEKHRNGWNRGKWALDWTVITVDAANKKTDRGSAYGMLAIGGKDMRRFVLDDRTRRGEFPEILDVLRDMIVTWRPDAIMIEAKAAGPSLMSSLENEMAAGKLRAHDLDAAGIDTGCNGLVVSIEVEGGQLWKCKKCGVETNGNPIICGVNGIEVDMDKERRVDAVLPQIAARVCYLLEGAEWLDAFVEEHALFPQSPWNDRVDALSQALEHYKDGPFYVL